MTTNALRHPNKRRRTVDIRVELVMGLASVSAYPEKLAALTLDTLAERYPRIPRAEIGARLAEAKARVWPEIVL